MSKHAGRRTVRFRAQRAEFRSKCKANDAPCWLCGKPIDYSLPYQHPECWNLDHAIPLSVRPELAEDPAGYRSSHKLCNERRGNREPHLDIGEPSEAW